MVKFQTVISALLIGFLLPIAGFSQQAKEQANQSLAIGSGVTFLGTGDLLASSLNVEYQLGLRDRIRASVWYGYFDGSFAEDYGPVNMTKVQTMDLLLYWRPAKSLSWFSMAAGPSFRWLKTLEADGYVANGSAYGSSGRPVFKKENALGLTALMNFRVWSGKNLSAGLRPVLQAQYTNGDIAWSLLGYVSFGW
ncbi:hypothetical protein [Marinoscillum sp.]|uniref:hypothetical protein n=1 Tax=Marinoscillum sp. TaxID=2024838 RepID=UPI003BAD72FF